MNRGNRRAIKDIWYDMNILKRLSDSWYSIYSILSSTGRWRLPQEALRIRGQTQDCRPYNDFVSCRARYSHRRYPIKRAHNSLSFPLGWRWPIVESNEKDGRDADDGLMSISKLMWRVKAPSEGDHWWECWRWQEIQRSDWAAEDNLDKVSWLMAILWRQVELQLV